MAAVDVGAVVSEIGAQVLPIASVGGAVLLLIVSFKAFGWLREAMGEPSWSPDDWESDFQRDQADAAIAWANDNPPEQEPFWDDSRDDMRSDEPIHPDEDEYYPDVDYSELSRTDEGYDEYDAKRAFWR